MKKIAYMLALPLLAYGCNESILIPEEEKEPEEVYVHADVISVSLDKIKVEVEVPGNATYFIDRYTAEEFKDIKVEKLVADLRERVRYGASWASFLKVGSREIVFDKLTEGTDYKILCFGLRADGELSCEPEVLDATTESLSFEMEVVETKPFSYALDIKPSRSDVGWFAFCFIGDPAKVSDEYLVTLMGYVSNQLRQQGALYDDLVQFGDGSYIGECNPDDKLFCAVVAVDEDFRILTQKPARLAFNPGTEGLLICGDNSTDQLHTLVYAYDHKELGVMMRVLKYDSQNPVFLENTIDFNGMTNSMYGVDMSTADGEQSAEAVGAYMQRQLNAAASDPTYYEYFASCQTPAEVMALMWYSSNYYYDEGSMWTPFSPDDIRSSIGGDIESISFIAGLYSADYQLKISTVDHSLSRCNFKEIGYTFEYQKELPSVDEESVLKPSSLSKVLEMMKPALLPSDPEFAQVHVRGLKKPVYLSR